MSFIKKFKAELKNPLFWFFIVMFAGGLLLFFIGWSRWESTHATRGGGAQMVAGGVMTVLGILFTFTYANGSKRKLP